MAGRDEDDFDRRRFNRRALIVGGVQTAAFAAVLARMYQLQVINGRAYRTLADDNRISEQPVLPRRGRILDRSGRVLAFNVERFRVSIRPSDRSRLRSSLQRLAPVLGLRPEEIEGVVGKAKAAPRNRPVLIRSSVPFDTVSYLGLRAADFADVEIDVVFDRAYAHGVAAGHVVGHTGSVDQHALDDDAYLRMPGARIGKTGVELGMERELRGAPGWQRAEVDARGVKVRSLAEADPVAGQDVVLTIDAVLQQRVMDRLAGERRAAAVAIDVSSGEVVVMASVPSYDPNMLTVSFDEAQFAMLDGHPDKPLINRAIAGLYPPGSTFKMVTALAALEAGAITTRQAVTCNGAFEFAGETYRCWNRGGHGSVDLAEAIRKSCDVYFYNLAERIGVDRIAAMARALGLGQTYFCGLGGQKDGLIPTTGWKRAVKGDGWLRGETILAGIGQGYVLATPLQLAVMTARIATGRAVVPTLMRMAQDQQPARPLFAPLNIAADGLDAVRAAMVGAVHAPDGTGGEAIMDGGEVLIAGKTGTSQVWASERGATAREERYDLRDHALFVSFFPATAPRYAIALVVEHGGSGGRAAAPLVRDISRIILTEAALATVEIPGSVR